MAMLDSSSRCDERLGEHLSTKDSLALLFRLNTAKDIDLNWFEIEESDEKIKRGTHGSIVAWIPGTATSLRSSLTP